MKEYMEPLVTICCITYNHEKYVEDTLKGFLMQKTTFPFEIIVNDDASTDRTAIILREYELQYPDKIKVIYHNENQWSKGIEPIVNFIFPEAKGKYVAICEGDDYWISPLKLQAQVEYMESHPDCSFCFTNAMVEDMSGEMPYRKFIPYEDGLEDVFNNESRVYDAGTLAALGFIPTASFLYPMSVYKHYPKSYEKDCCCGDMKIKLFAASIGYAYYMNFTSCVYREHSSSSMMDSWRKSSREQKYARNLSVVNMLHDFNHFTKNKYQQQVYELQKRYLMTLIKNAKDRSVFEVEGMTSFYNGLSKRTRLKIYLLMHLPEKVVEYWRYRKKGK